MEDLVNGLNEKGLIDFMKTVLLSGDNPRGEEATKNIEWGINQYRKHLILQSVSRQSELLESFANWLQSEIWDDKYDDFSEYVEDYIKTL